MRPAVIVCGFGGFFLEVAACFEAAFGDYRPAFWLLLVGTVLTSWSWRIWKASQRTAHNEVSG